MKEFQLKVTEHLSNIGTTQLIIKKAEEIIKQADKSEDSNNKKRKRREILGKGENNMNGTQQISTRNNMSENSDNDNVSDASNDLDIEYILENSEPDTTEYALNELEKAYYLYRRDIQSYSTSSIKHNLEAAAQNLKHMLENNQSKIDAVNARAEEILSRIPCDLESANIETAAVVQPHSSGAQTSVGSGNDEDSIGNENIDVFKSMVNEGLPSETEFSQEKFGNLFYSAFTKATGSKDSDGKWHDTNVRFGEYGRKFHYTRWLNRVIPTLLDADSWPEQAQKYDYRAIHPHDHHVVLGVYTGQNGESPNLNSRIANMRYIEAKRRVRSCFDDLSVEDTYHRRAQAVFAAIFYTRYFVPKNKNDDTRKKVTDFHITRFVKCETICDIEGKFQTNHWQEVTTSDVMANAYSALLRASKKRKKKA